MWVWEGRGNATALWQAKRRAQDRKQQDRTQPPQNISKPYRSDRITWVTERLAGLYWQWTRWYSSGKRGPKM
jgi:hypothetical protein